MNKITSYKTSTFSGDLIYLMNGIRQSTIGIESKADIYLWLDRPGKAYDGAEHPYGVSMLNRYTLDMLRPLLESQPYVNSVREWRGEEIIVDLDHLRTQHVAKMMPYGNIARWHGYAWPDMQTDVSVPWITLDDFVKDPDVIGKILINRTSRYQNHMIHYWFLKDYQDQLLFIGMPEEHASFCKQWELNIPHYTVKNFLELAIAIWSCEYMIGNQSMCFALAEAMKTPRLLEVCEFAPNVIPVGGHGYDFLHQFALEWFVKNSRSPLNQL